MKVSLLDVNALIALLWPSHEFYAAAQRWFLKQAKHGWATCPFTEAGFVRIVSNPAFSRDAVTPSEAVKVLEMNLQHKSHHFWPVDITLAGAVRPFVDRMPGHRQVTDAYLLGIARHHGGRLATFDERIVAMLPEGSGSAVELIDTDG